MENFEKILTVNKINMRYAKGKSLLSGNEIHPYNEILYYMGGNATFLCEKFREKLTENDLVIIPKETYHRFEIKDQENYTRLVFNYPDFDEDFVSDEIKIIKNADSSLLGKMCKAMKNNANTKAEETYLYGAFLMLLSELSMKKDENFFPEMRKNDELISKCVSYIDQNFAKDISADSLAQKMNVSSSTLFHCFKKELGISLYRYITEKRLIYANRLITLGEKPTKIFTRCGYKDYPTFYKAYIKMFGHSPANKKETY